MGIRTLKAGYALDSRALGSPLRPAERRELLAGGAVLISASRHDVSRGFRSLTLLGIAPEAFWAAVEAATAHLCASGFLFVRSTLSMFSRSPEEYDQRRAVLGGEQGPWKLLFEARRVPTLERLVRRPEAFEAVGLPLPPVSLGDAEVDLYARYEDGRYWITFTIDDLDMDLGVEAARLVGGRDLIENPWTDPDHEPQ